MSSSIMLVSADREMARVLRAALKETPVKLTVETISAKTAGEALVTGQIDLVVLDLFLPHGSGLDMLKILKRSGEKIPFLLLSRMRTRAVIERAFRYGAHDILPYPVTGDILRDTILHRLESQPLEDSDEDKTKKA